MTKKINDRIRALTEQAGITTNLDTDYFEKDMNKWVDYFSEKFAELLLEEFIEALEESNGTHSETSEYGLSILVGDIKQHFGVEE